jgi:hypothetical protein
MRVEPIASTFSLPPSVQSHPPGTATMAFDAAAAAAALVVPGARTAGELTFAHLTPDDRTVLAATTGIHVNSRGTVVEKHPVESPNWGLLFQVDADRRDGLLTGDIDTGYIEALLLRAQHGHTEMPRLDGIVGYLRTRENGISASSVDTRM